MLLGMLGLPETEEGALDGLQVLVRVKRAMAENLEIAPVLNIPFTEMAKEAIRREARIGWSEATTAK